MTNLCVYIKFESWFVYYFLCNLDSQVQNIFKEYTISLKQRKSLENNKVVTLL